MWGMCHADLANLRLPFRDRCACQVANTQSAQWMQKGLELPFKLWIMELGVLLVSALMAWVSASILAVHTACSLAPQALCHPSVIMFSSVSAVTEQGWAVLWKICNSALKVRELSVCMSVASNPTLESRSFFPLIAAIILLPFAFGFMLKSQSQPMYMYLPLIYFNCSNHY